MRLNYKTAVDYPRKTRKDTDRGTCEKLTRYPMRECVSIGATVKAGERRHAWPSDRNPALSLRLTAASKRRAFLRISLRNALYFPRLFHIRSRPASLASPDRRLPVDDEGTLHYLPALILRRDSQVVRPGSAKPLSAGSIPAPASPPVFIRVAGSAGYTE